MLYYYFIFNCTGTIKHHKHLLSQPPIDQPTIINPLLMRPISTNCTNEYNNQKTATVAFTVGCLFILF